MGAGEDEESRQGGGEDVVLGSEEESGMQTAGMHEHDADVDGEGPDGGNDEEGNTAGDLVCGVNEGDAAEGKDVVMQDADEGEEGDASEKRRAAAGQQLDDDDVKMQNTVETSAGEHRDDADHHAEKEHDSSIRPHKDAADKDDDDTHEKMMSDGHTDRVDVRKESGDDDDDLTLSYTSAMGKDNDIVVDEKETCEIAKTADKVRTYICITIHTYVLYV
jgi:hypothetical protein